MTIVGSLIIICLSAINTYDNKAARYTLMVNVLFFTLGSIALVNLGNMYDAHLTHIKRSEEYKSTLEKVRSIKNRGCFSNNYPEINSILITLTDDISILLDFVENKYMAIGWANSIYFVLVMIFIIGIVFFWFANSK